MKKIFDGVLDEGVHLAFLKFGRGEFKDKYLIEGKRQMKRWAVKAGPEYVNFLVRRCLEKVDGLVRIKGVIISTQMLNGIDFVKVSNFQGVRKHFVDGEIEVSNILDFIRKFPKAFFALSFSGRDFELKIKAKAPISGKPRKEKNDEASVDFCSLKTNDKNIIDELFFGIGDFGEVKISYTIKIDDIIYPENIENFKPSEVRELSKRKGVVIRNVVVDGDLRKEKMGFIV